MILPSLKQIEKFAVNNSPTILTVIGVVGTIGTAVLTHKAANKARTQVEDKGIKIKYTKPGSPDACRRDEFLAVWKHYIPPAGMGIVTVGSIIMANRIGSKRAAAIAAAYTISERAYTEYREKVIEKIGDTQERKIREEVVQDRIRNNPPTEGNVLMVGDGDHIFLEMYTGRYFRSDMHTVKDAVNQINYQINTHGYASMSDFYQLIALPNTTVSDEMGWNGDKLLEVDYTAVLSEMGQPCVAIDFVTVPVRRHDRFH